MHSKQNLIPIIDFIGNNNYQITILNNSDIYSYHGVMYFPNYESAFNYTKRYIRNVITLTKFFGVDIYQIKKNYKFN
jgi:hypothetical protein